MHYISQLCEGENLQMLLKELHRYADEQNEGNMELQILERKHKRVCREINNIIKAIKGGFEAEELQEEYDILKADKMHLEELIDAEKRNRTQPIMIDNTQVKKALAQISQEICDGKPIEDYKKLFSAFVDRIEAFEDYVTIVLNVFDMIGVYTTNRLYSEMKEPPLDFHQMVVWNGGGDGNRTRVRKSIHTAFSGWSLSFGIPLRARRQTGLRVR